MHANIHTCKHTFQKDNYVPSARNFFLIAAINCVLLLMSKLSLTSLIK